MKINKNFLFPIEIEPDGERGMMGGAWCLAFVYAPNGNYLIKGYHREVKKYIEKTFEQGLVNYTLWHSLYGIKCSRNIWDFIGNRLTIYEPQRPNRIGKRQSKWQIYDVRKDEVVMELKRLPNCWIPEYSEFDK